MIYRNMLLILFVALSFTVACDVRAENDPDAVLEALVVSDPGDRESIRAVQQALADLGFEPGVADGLLGGKTRAALRDWQEGNDTEIAPGWLEVPQASTGPGWRCTTAEEAAAHPGSASTQRGDLISNIVVMMTMDGAQYMGSADGAGMHPIPPPPTHCPDGAVYDD